MELNEKQGISAKEYEAGLDRISRSFKMTEQQDLEFVNRYSLIDLLELVEEESGEFIKAYHKYKRSNGIIGPVTPVTVDEAISDVKEELCDILFTVVQCMQKLQMFNEFDFWRGFKSARSKERNKTICKDL